MTPAIIRAKRAKIKFNVHEYEHTPSAHAYGKEAVIKMNVSASRVFKTLVVSLDSKNLAVAVLPVSRQLDLKRFAKAMGTKRVNMAEKHMVERSTGYVVGGVSPIGQKKKLRTLIDESAMAHETIYVSAGRRGLEIELDPCDLCALTGGRFEAISK